MKKLYVGIIAFVIILILYFFGSQQEPQLAPEEIFCGDCTDWEEVGCGRGTCGAHEMTYGRTCDIPEIRDPPVSDGDKTGLPLLSPGIPKLSPAPTQCMINCIPNTICNILPVISNPNPIDGAIDQPITGVVLSWDAVDDDEDSIVYDVYFGESLVLVSSDQTETTYVLGGLSPGTTYLWQIVAKDSFGEFTGEVWSFSTLDAFSISVSLSNAMATGIAWDISELPVTDQDAGGNNGVGITDYNAQIDATGTNVDIYVRANGNLISGGNSILLNNEEFSYSLIDGSIPGGVKYPLTTNYLDNLIGENLPSGTNVYFKFFLTVPGGQSPGLYSNLVDVKAVPHGDLP
ncbi:fibronectin type III domain-containing protein [Candidatus Woesearchaeota archaeon]|jgi:hypothetical protein|nr:fibronectin type III domain-containing protein [Candidatus Woesearchaeota archaeon]MBT7237330.1 fibronectin type III domain-containing protein [Candidatus Woesearchaeota archaeon]